MIPILNDYDWENAFGENNITLRYERVLPDRENEKLSIAPCTREDVKDILFHQVGENDGPSWIAIGHLKDGRYFSLEAGCDYTGWDCQASGVMSYASTKRNLFKFGVDDDMRRRFEIDIQGRPVPPVRVESEKGGEK